MVLRKDGRRKEEKGEKGRRGEGERLKWNISHLLIALLPAAGCQVST